MPRPRTAPKTQLGLALIERRGDASLFAVEAETGLTYTTLSRLERGAHRPSADTALKLARWLGWTMEEVMAAADQPTPTSDTPSQQG